jgi:hypothetical protein
MIYLDKEAGPTDILQKGSTPGISTRKRSGYFVAVDSSKFI